MVRIRVRNASSIRFTDRNPAAAFDVTDYARLDDFRRDVNNGADYTALNSIDLRYLRLPGIDVLSLQT